MPHVNLPFVDLDFPILLSIYHGFPSNGMMPHVTYGPHLSSCLIHSAHDMWHLALEPLTICQVSLTTPYASKNVKFRPSRNWTKFDVVARFRKIIPTAKFVHHPRSRKILDFLPKLSFYPPSEIWIFRGFTVAGDNEEANVPSES